MALANSNTIICHILPGPHLYTWVESSNVDKLPCWRIKVHGDVEIRTPALSVTVEWILQYTTTPPLHDLINYWQNNNSNNKKNNEWRWYKNYHITMMHSDKQSELNNVYQNMARVLFILNGKMVQHIGYIYRNSSLRLFSHDGKVRILNRDSRCASWIMIRNTVFWTMCTPNHVEIRDLRCASQITVQRCFRVTHLKSRISTWFGVHTVQNTVYHD